MTIDEQVANKLGCEIKPFSTQIAAAWEVVEVGHAVKLSKNPIGPKWSCQLLTEEMADKSEYPDCFYADTAPMAICLAFLRMQ